MKNSQVCTIILYWVHIIFMKLAIKSILCSSIIITSLAVQHVVAQAVEDKVSSLALDYNLNYMSGFAIKHDRFMGHLTKGITKGVAVNISKRTYGTNDWQILTNYPDVGLSISYYDYGSEIMGESIGINYFTDYYLFRWRKLASTYRVGVGIGYHTNPYDIDTNNKNIALPWAFTFSLQSSLGLQYDVADRWRIKSALNLYHYSFADIKRPNKGVNILTAQLGVSYFTGDPDRTYKDELSTSFDKSTLRFNFMFHGSIVTFQPADEKIYPVYGMSMYVQKPISRLFDIHLGVDGFNNHVVREIIKRDENIKTDDMPDHKRAGVHGGFEYYMGNLSIIMSFGRYFYKPYTLHSNYYQKYGIKIYLTKDWFFYGGFKSHGSNAENSEFGLGYRL